ncbi:Asp23/Gls24 family envelope stress response protein [Saccharopolyspora shandongensis]|uniref:Asp23/Gls24 family envelope stress response protein n=1 Tax=Saccharopolyspora shandongensis TaxID=418495 RepID=UPI0033D4225A
MTTGPDSGYRFDEGLPCGAAVDDVFAQVADGHAARRSTHQAGCPHCQAALAEYDRLWSPVREVADAAVHPPDSPLQAALSHIRGTVHNPTYGVLTSDDGQTRIAARVVVVIAREAAQNVPGVRVALSRLRLPGGDPVERENPVRVGLAGQSAAIVLTVAATYGTDLHELAERIRSAVAEQVRAATGLEPVAITIAIEDVFAARTDISLAE